jgi:hypothetical protein
MILIAWVRERLARFGTICRRHLGFWLGFCLSSACSLAIAGEAPVEYQDIPPQYGFPALPSVLEHDLSSADVTAQRRHAWSIVAGVTSLTKTGIPIWVTWYTRLYTFRALESDEGTRHKLSLSFLRQAVIASNGGHQFEVAPQLSDILFNKPAYDHIRKNGLYLKSALAEMNAAFPPGTPVWKRAIPAFPINSVALKVVYWPIKRDALTPLPVWDSDPAARYSPQTPLPANPVQSWKRVVAVDPNLDRPPPPEVFVDIPFNGQIRAKAHVVSLHDFYFIRLDPELLAAMKQNMYFMASVGLVFGPGRTVEVGDYIVVVALHATTKELPAWIWLTTWWHDHPNDGPFAVGRPNAVAGPWRNYLMAETYDAYQPTVADGSPNITYNPWMEAVDHNGIQSNCIACHARATYPGVASDPATRGLNDLFYNADLFPGGKDPAFDGKRLMLDALWSIFIESDPPVPPTVPPAGIEPAPK